MNARIHTLKETVAYIAANAPPIAAEIALTAWIYGASIIDVEEAVNAAREAVDAKPAIKHGTPGPKSLSNLFRF